MSNPGTYILVLDQKANAVLTIGKKGPFCFPTGLWLYVGSALGPGGLKARLGRYVKGPKRLHWHIDYLLPSFDIRGAFFHNGPEKLECQWSAHLKRLYSSPIPRFGSTDCQCPTHLFLAKETLTNVVRDLAQNLDVQFKPTRELTEWTQS